MPTVSADEALALLRALDAQDTLYDRAQLERELPRLTAAGSALWLAAFSHMHTRFNRALLLNAPELWTHMDAADWAELLLAPQDRSYSPGDVFATGRFDDIKFLCRFFGVDAVRWYCELSAARGAELEEARRWVARHVRACAPMYLPPEDLDEELDGTQVSAEQLRSFGEKLRQQQPTLRPVPQDEASLVQELEALAPGGA